MRVRTGPFMRFATQTKRQLLEDDPGVLQLGMELEEKIKAASWEEIRNAVFTAIDELGECYTDDRPH